MKTKALLFTENQKLPLSIVTVILASLLIALVGKLSIPLGFTPVPLALRSCVVMVLACLLGYRKTSLAVLGFLAQAAIGLPVMAGSQLSLFGPTGGYCIGYFFQAVVVGFLAERLQNRSVGKTFAILFLGSVLLYAFGVPQLALFIGWKEAFVLGVVPFLIGDLIKLVLMVQVLRSFGWISK
jgi:biotin transport system substrate-specific component